MKNSNALETLATIQLGNVTGGCGACAGGDCTRGAGGPQGQRKGPSGASDPSSGPKQGGMG